MSAAAAAVEEVLDLCVSDYAWCSPAQPAQPSPAQPGPALRWSTLTLGAAGQLGVTGPLFISYGAQLQQATRAFRVEFFIFYIDRIDILSGFRVKDYIEVKMDEF